MLIVFLFFKKKPKENICTDWLKIVFLQLDRNMELAQAVVAVVSFL